MSSPYEGREQAEIKHLGLRLYLEAAARILGTVYNSFKFVDCCAGPWESTSPDCSDTSFGVACQSLDGARAELAGRGRHVRFSALLIEKSVDAYKKLSAYVASKSLAGIEMRAENWDFTQHISDITAYCSELGSFPLIFVDPWGWNLARISTIKPLLQVRPGEVLINLMSSYIKRFVNDPRCDLSDLVGTDAPAIRELRGSEQEYAIVRKYCELVRAAGNFKYVCALPIMHPDREEFIYYLIYATRHEKGVQVFKDVERRTESITHVVRAEAQQRRRSDESANFELFPPSVLYRENKYRELSNSNQLRAKARVMELIQARKRLVYDDCWAEALQFSAVYQEHLRSWMTSWEKERVIAIEGRKKNSEFLKIDSNHVIVYLL